MKNKLFFFVALFAQLHLVAQVSRLQTRLPGTSNSSTLSLKEQLEKHYLTGKSGWSFVPEKQIIDPLGNTHIRFVLNYLCKPIIDHELKASLNPKGEWIRLQVNGISSLPSSISDDSKPENFDSWKLVNGKFIPIKTSKEKNEKGILVQKLYSLNGELVEERVLDLMNRKDSLNSTRVFNPDPLTTAQKTYGADGGIWVNSNGNDYPEINAERKLVQVPLAFRNDTFFAEHQHAIILDLETPVNTPFTSITPNPEFTRSQSGFREMMCLFHIYKLQEYLKSIGLDSLANFQIKVDPTAFQGQDQSRFSFDNDDPSLYFGTGGVPDAEDADVIIHEYSHGINYSIAPNSTNGLQRLAVEEANCDFMATQYSKAISDFKWRDVFNWDGHNVYWDGRNTNTTKKYPDDLSSDFYSSAEIWSSMLNDLSLDLGREVTTKILLGSIYFYTNGMNMQEAADLLVVADSLYYGRAHYEPLKVRLAERGFDVALGLHLVSNSLSGIRLINSYGFAQAEAPLIIETSNPQNLELSIVGIAGKQIHQFKFNQSTQVPSDLLPAGVWLLKLKDENNQTASFKVIKFR